MNLPLGDRAAILAFAAGNREPTAVGANPMAQALGMRLLEVDDGRGVVLLDFEPAAQFVQGTGVLQGGAVAGMLDFAMAFATLATLGAAQSCATVNMTTSFLRAAPPGRYRARGEIQRRGRTMAFVRAELTAGHDPQTTIATATSVLAIIG